MLGNQIFWDLAVNPRLGRLDPRCVARYKESTLTRCDYARHNT